MLLTMPQSDRLQASKQFLAAALSWIRGRLQERFRLMKLAEQIRSEREALSKLSNAELQDIGIHRADADAEVRRDYWDLPAVRANNRDE